MSLLIQVSPELFARSGCCCADPSQYGEAVNETIVVKFPEEERATVLGMVERTLQSRNGDSRDPSVDGGPSVSDSAAIGNQRNQASTEQSDDVVEFVTVDIASGDNQDAAVDDVTVGADSSAKHETGASSVPLVSETVGVEFSRADRRTPSDQPVKSSGTTGTGDSAYGRIRTDVPEIEHLCRPSLMAGKPVFDKNFELGEGVHDGSALYISRSPVQAGVKRLWFQLITWLVVCAQLYDMVDTIRNAKLCLFRQSTEASLSGLLAMSVGLFTVCGRLKRTRFAVKQMGCVILSEAIAGYLVGGVVYLTILKDSCSQGSRQDMLDMIARGNVILMYLAAACVFLHFETWWRFVFIFIGSCELVTSVILLAVGAPEFIPIHLAFSFAYYTIAFSAMLYKKWTLRKAEKALQPDRANYDKRWLTIVAAQAPILAELTDVVKKHVQVKVTQPSTDLEHLMKLSAAANQWYQNVIEDWARELQVGHKEAPVKKLARVQQKVDRSYNGDVSRVLDFVRSTIIVKTAEQAKRVLEFILQQTIVHKVKNRYDPDYDGKETAGYRDINMQLSFRELDGTAFEKYVFELQIIFETFLEVKSSEGHRRYIVCRNLRGD